MISDVDGGVFQGELVGGFQIDVGVFVGDYCDFVFEFV